MKKDKILKQAGVLLLVIMLLFSAAVAMANDKNEDTILVKAFPSDQFLPQNIMLQGTWLYYHDTIYYTGIGLSGGTPPHTFEGAIRLTSEELEDYVGSSITMVEFYHHVVPGTSETHSGEIKIYSQGSSSIPGSLISQQPYTVTGTGWKELSLDNPIEISNTDDIWISIEITHGTGEFPLGVDSGPATPFKGDFVYASGLGWTELRLVGDPPLNYNWLISAKVESTTDPLIVNAGGPYSGIVGNEIQFQGSAQGGTEPYIWSWDFGDGNTAREQNPTHTYSDDGEYTVILTVEDDTSQSAIDETTATIAVEPDELNCSAGGPYEGLVNQPLQFFGEASGGIPPYSFSWDFGDGATSNEENPTYTYTEPGNYDVVLIVTDSNGQTATDETTATISDDGVNENILIIHDATGPAGEDITIDFEIQNDDDFYFFELDIPLPDDFSYVSGSAVLNPDRIIDHWITGSYFETTNTLRITSYSPLGQSFIGNSGIIASFDLTTSENPGVYLLEVTNPVIGDSNGNNIITGSIDGEVILTGEPLIADAGGPYSAIVGETIDFIGSATNGISPYIFDWDFGNGDTSDEQNPSYAYSEAGTYTVSLTVTDYVGEIATAQTTADISAQPSDPQLSCAGSLSWVDVKPGETVTGEFTVQNSGDPESLLNWEVQSYPSWGTWTFTPGSGVGLTPEDGAVTVTVEVVAPDDPGTEFSGEIVLVNIDDPDDNCVLEAILITNDIEHTELVIENIKGPIGVSTDVKNAGAIAAENVAVDIAITGGLLGRVNKNVSAPIAALAVGASETIGSGLVIGIGPIDIVITASADNADEVRVERSGFLLGILVLGL